MSKVARRMTKIEEETKKRNSRQMNKWRGVLRGEDVGGVQISPPLHSEKAEIRGSWLKRHCQRNEALYLAFSWHCGGLFSCPSLSNEREPEGNSRGDAGSKRTKIVMLCDWDRQREQMQKRLRGWLRKWESSQSNYQTLSIVSLPRATLQGTKCKITLLRADVDNCIRKDSKISDTLLFFRNRPHLICDDYIEYCWTSGMAWQGSSSQQNQHQQFGLATVLKEV